MKDQRFIEAIRQSFETYLQSGSRSNAKLKPLHGTIASDLQKLFGNEFKVMSLGFNEGREDTIDGRYFPKTVDIVVKKGDVVVAGYAVKFVTRNYLQNSVNYFENMLGETANIRTARIPYFQLFIIFDKVPYYDKNGKFMRYDKISYHNIQKYLVLSNDDPIRFYHTPDKVLLAILHLKEKSPDYQFKNAKDYATYYQSVLSDGDLLKYSDSLGNEFGSTCILNDYELFLRKSYHLADGAMGS